MTRRISLSDVHDLASAALRAAGARESTAEIVAQSIMDAEADGIRLIGLAYLPTYCRHLEIRKVDGQALPVIHRVGPAGLIADAKNGFCHAAFVAAENDLMEMAREQGIAGLGINRSYASGVIGWFCERIANAGLLGITVTNASPTMAPYGGHAPVFGTNPIAIGVPRAEGPPLVIDTSPAATTRLEIKRRAAEGELLPLGWGLDASGHPTSNAEAVLDGGTVAPLGGHKGAALALMIEVLAAGLSGARWSFEASDLGDEEGGPPEIGQFFIAVDPVRFAGTGFFQRIEVLLGQILQQEGTRLPGDRRLRHRDMAAVEGVAVPESLFAELERLANP
jgi:(2R)-3-sulfolactate dehydrogenase (NADP+)